MFRRLISNRQDFSNRAQRVVKRRSLPSYTALGYTQNDTALLT
jgi:hypothetical protein